MYLVVAKVEVKVDEVEAILAKLRTYIAIVLENEPGTAYFEVYQPAIMAEDGENRLTILEGYTDEEAFKAHLEMHYREEHLGGIRSHLVDGGAEQFLRIE